MLVSHGLSYIASTAFNEQGFPPDVIEAALVHVDKNEVRYAYNCSDYLEQHRPMMYMVGWFRYISKLWCIGAWDIKVVCLVEKRFDN